MGLRISPVGWGAVAVAALGLVLGRWFGWLELAALGAALTAVLLVSLLMTAGPRPLRRHARHGRPPGKVGERALGRLEVRNVARRRSLPSRIELPVGAVVAELAVPALAPGASHDDLFAIPTTRRAVIVVGPVRSVRGDPFGLVRRSVRWTRPTEVFVHPLLVSLAGCERRPPARPGGPGDARPVRLGPVVPRPARLRRG